MKIGIMTLWAAFDNYGQQFQVYSLQHYLRSHGFDAFIIRYRYKSDVRRKKWYEYFYTIKYLFDLDYIKFKITNLNSIEKSKSIDRKFDIFANKYINFSEKDYKNINELKTDPPEADVYITGSDQIWNFSAQYKPYENKIKAFFLDFGNDKTKRIAYAASFGRSSYGKKLQKFVLPFLNKFDFITCREQQGINICKSVGVNSKITLDPVFLNNKEEYLKLINIKEIPINENFCLIYLLNNATEIPYEKIKILAKKNNLRIVFIPGKGLEQSYFEPVYATPEEWLWYMANAKFVITNSFHGTAFSIILNKNFSVLPLSGKNSLNQNDRIFTMLKLLEIDFRVIGLKENPLELIFNWEKIEKLIKEKNEEVGLLKFLKQYEK